ncbi:MAG: hypothetical protein RIQ52_2052 [Pseudomonadota bacterium]|jgi:hypothetical protein
MPKNAFFPMPAECMLPMSLFAASGKTLLDTEEQAEQVVAELVHMHEEHSAASIELDFTGVRDASEPFLENLFNLARQHLPGVWLIPRHYHPRIRSHLHEQLYAINCQREQCWRLASENPPV